MNRSDHPRHSIDLVARRTGLTPAAIRTWERRYGAIAPTRTPSRHRLFTDSDVERLRLLRQVTLAGRRIGSVAELATEKLESMVQEDGRQALSVPAAGLPSPGGRATDPLVEDCLEALGRFDVHRLDTALARARADMGALDLMERVLIPLLHTVGRRWTEGAVSIHEEHLLTSMVRTQLESLRLGHPRSPGGPAIVVATPSAERHELGALMVAVAATARDWDVAYLGADISPLEIAAAARRTSAKAVALSIVHPDDGAGIDVQLTTLRSMLSRDTVVFVGGRGSKRYAPQLAEIGAVVPDSLRSLAEVLERIRRQSC